jgi:hypothetical protein
MHYAEFPITKIGVRRVSLRAEAAGKTSLEPEGEEREDYHASWVSMQR